MRLLEDSLKPLLRQHGVRVPTGALAGSTDDLSRFLDGRDRVVLKALESRNNRASRGMVIIAPAADAGAALAHLRDLAPQVWMEEAIDHGHEEYFLGLLWTGEHDQPTLIVAEGGGVGFEARVQGSGAVQSCAIKPGGPIAANVLPLIASTPGMRDLAEAAAVVFEAIGGISLELNPVVRDAQDRLVPLDAKAYIDPYALRTSVIEKSYIAGECKLEFAPLRGRVGLLSIGAGLTRAVIDWLEYLGPGAACFSDLIPAVLADAPDLLAGRPGAECIKSVDWLCRWLESTGRDRLLVTLVSGGTPIDALSQSVLAGLTACGWSGTTVAFVAGNRAGEATKIWASAGRRAETTLIDAMNAVAS